jgi:hypothetical protein
MTCKKEFGTNRICEIDLIYIGFLTLSNVFIQKLIRDDKNLRET